MTENKWTKYKGDISMKIGSDEFIMRLGNEELPIFFQISKELGSSMANISKGTIDVLLGVCKRGLKKANPDVESAQIDEFVKNNGVKLVTALLKELGE